MEPILPTIEDISNELNGLPTGWAASDENWSFFVVQKAQVQALLHIAQELEAINNNLEALRPNLPKGYSL